MKLVRLEAIKELIDDETFAKWSEYKPRLLFEVVPPDTEITVCMGSSSSSVALTESWWTSRGPVDVVDERYSHWSAGTAGGSFTYTTIRLHPGAVVVQYNWDDINGPRKRVRGWVCLPQVKESEQPAEKVTKVTKEEVESE